MKLCLFPSILTRLLIYTTVGTAPIVSAASVDAFNLPVQMPDGSVKAGTIEAETASVPSACYADFKDTLLRVEGVEYNISARGLPDGTYPLLSQLCQTFNSELTLGRGSIESIDSTQKTGAMLTDFGSGRFKVTNLNNTYEVLQSLSCDKPVSPNCPNRFPTGPGGPPDFNGGGND